MTGQEFDGLVHAHERMVRALALSYVRDASAADDVVQETFLRAWRSMDGLRDASRVKTWLYTLARNASIDWLRRAKRQRAEELTMDVAAPEPRESRGDLVDKVMRILDGLREDYRRLVLLRFVDEMSYAEIAETLGMSVGAVGEKLHRVRRMVVERMGS